MSYRVPEKKLKEPELSAKEALALYLEMDNVDAIGENGVGKLSAEKIAEIAGDEWRKKLGKMRLQEEETDDHLIAIDANAIYEIALSPPSVDELSLLIRNRFSSAANALASMYKRLAQNPDVKFFCEERTVENVLGPLWRERLDRINVSCERIEDSQGKTQIYMPMGKLFNKDIREKLRHVGVDEYRNSK
jgi:hypothetical protein